jgi:hypothetical protein
MTIGWSTAARQTWCCAMDTEADKLRRDLERYYGLISRITDEEAVGFLIEMIGEAALRLKEIEAVENIPEE